MRQRAEVLHQNQTIAHCFSIEFSLYFTFMRKSCITMDEVVEQVTHKVGLPAVQARQTVDTVVEFSKVND